MLNEVKARMQEKKLLMRQGTLIDAALIAAQPSTKTEPANATRTGIR